MTRLPRSRRPVRLSTVLAVGVVLGILATRPLLDAIAESARRPTGRMGRLLYGPAPAGLAPYRRILDALGLRADDVLLEIGPGGNFLARAARAGRESCRAIVHRGPRPPRPYRCGPPQVRELRDRTNADISRIGSYAVVRMRTSADQPLSEPASRPRIKYRPSRT